MNRKRVSYAPTEDEEDSPTAPTSRGRIDPDFVLSAIDVPVSHCLSAPGPAAVCLCRMRPSLACPWEAMGPCMRSSVGMMSPGTGVQSSAAFSIRMEQACWVLVQPHTRHTMGLR